MEISEFIFESIANRKNIVKKYDVLIKSHIAFPAKSRAKIYSPLLNGYSCYSSAMNLYPAINLKLALKKKMVFLLWPFTSLLKKNHVHLGISIDKGSIKELYATFSEKKKYIDKVESFALRVGSAGDGFKLIFQFQDAYGKPLSYIKVCDKNFRGEYLINEKRTLEYLHSLNVSVPAVKGFLDSENFLSIEISPLNNIKYFPRPSIEKVARFLAEFCNLTSSKDDENKLKNTGEENINKFINNDKTKNLIIRSIDYINDCKFPRPYTHRDLASWNLFTDSTGKLGILDWEFAKENHLPFQDLFHYLIHTKINNSNLSPIDAYKEVFYGNKKIDYAVDIYSSITEITDKELIHNLRILYLWDWFQLERSRDSKNNFQGSEYLYILNWIADNEHSN